MCFSVFDIRKRKKLENGKSVWILINKKNKDKKTKKNKRNGLNSRQRKSQRKMRRKRKGRKQRRNRNNRNVTKVKITFPHECECAYGKVKRLKLLTLDHSPSGQIQGQYYLYKRSKVSRDKMRDKVNNRLGKLKKYMRLNNNSPNFKY